jgi:uncharacterized protein GlcG (DUF336 family)
MAAAQGADTGGYGLHMWLVMVDRTGEVCHVMNSSGENGRSTGNHQWLGSRVIAAQKAYTANAFSLDGYAISTANLFTATQQPNSLFELPESNPVNPDVAYAGPANQWGTSNDPLRGQRMGGVNVFGGGLPIYKIGGSKIGAIGVSGDTSCRDHAYAFAIRQHLAGAGVAGPQPDGTGITTFNLQVDGTGAINLADATTGDEMVLDLDGTDGDAYWANWEHAACPNTNASAAGVVEN